MTEKPKIYDYLTIRQSIERMLEDGYRPATLKEVWDLSKQGKIPPRRYHTGTLFLEGEIKDATIEQLRNIEEIYDNGGRLFCVGNFRHGGLYAYLCLYGRPRFVGVRDGAQKILSPNLEQRV